MFVAQPLGFEHECILDHVFKLNKSLYGRKQVPRALYEQLKMFLLENNYIVGILDSTLYL